MKACKYVNTDPKNISVNNLYLAVTCSVIDSLALTLIPPSPSSLPSYLVFVLQQISLLLRVVQLLALSVPLQAIFLLTGGRWVVWGHLTRLWFGALLCGVKNVMQKKQTRRVTSTCHLAVKVPGPFIYPAPLQWTVIIPKSFSKPSFCLVFTVYAVTYTYILCTLTIFNTTFYADDTQRHASLKTSKQANFHYLLYCLLNITCWTSQNIPAKWKDNEKIISLGHTDWAKTSCLRVYKC